MNIIKGKIWHSKTKEETIKHFVMRWNFKIEEIKKASFDNKQGYDTAGEFIEEFINFIKINSLQQKENLIITQLSNDLYLALRYAHSNFRKENKSFKALFWQDKLKLPPIEFNIPKISSK